MRTLSLRSAGINYHSMINQLENYMSQKKFPIEVQNKILYYYRIRFQKKYFKEAIVSSLLSGKCRLIKKNQIN